MFKRLKNENTRLKSESFKHVRYYSMLIHWLEIRQENRSLVEYFEKNGYKKVAIYGMKEFGERLFDELKGTSVEVAYTIDRNADEIYCEVPVRKPNDNLDKVDAMIVTAVISYDSIKEDLSKKVDCPIINLEDIVFGVH